MYLNLFHCLSYVNITKCKGLLLIKVTEKYKHCRTLKTASESFCTVEFSKLETLKFKLIHLFM